jgi:hypothetical protein
MNKPLTHGGLPRLLAWLLLGWLSLVGHAGYAQSPLFYTLNDGNATTTTDQLRRIGLDGAADALLKNGFVQAPGSAVVDAANNRVLVADARFSQPSTSLTNTKIVAVSLAASNAVSTLLTPTYIAGSTATSVAGLALDRTNGYLYYTLNDGNAATTTDQLRRVNLDGTGDVLLKSGFVQAAGPLVLDAVNNRVLVADTRLSQSSTSLTNTKIVAVSLAAGNAVSTLITPTFIANSTSTAVSGLALDRTTGYLYYTLSDGNATTMTDQLRRVNLDGTGDVLLKSGFVQAAGLLVLDAANNRVLVADARLSQASTGLTNAKIVAVSLAAGNAVSTLLTPTSITGATSTAISSLALLEGAAPTVTTATTSNLTTTSATLGGTLTSNGGAALTDYGIVYVQGTGTPTTNDTKVQVGTTSPATLPSTFSANATGLLPGTTYTVRAYATNSVGTGYGSAVSFTTTQAITATPVLNTPANNSTTSGRPTFAGTAPSGSTVTVTLTNTNTGTTTTFTTTATNGAFSVAPGSTLASGNYAAYATAQLNGQPVSVASNSTTFMVDATAPTATLSTTAGSATSTSPIPFTVTFSEPVTGFAASSITVTNGTITTALTSAGNAYSFSVTPTSNSVVTVSVAANAAQDAVGNGNLAAGPLSVTYAAPVTATTWTGAMNTDWFDARNWTQGVPTTTVDATIPGAPSGGRFPTIAAGTATTRNLTLNAGASLRMSDGTLDVRGTLTNNGAFVATGGTVVLGTSTLGNIVGSSTTNFWGLQVESSGARLATSSGATMQQVLTLNGGFSTNGNSFTLLSKATGTALVVNNGGNVVSGTTTVQRYIDPSLNPGLGYRHYSTPVSNSTVADLATSGFTPVVNPAYNTSPTPNAVVPFPTVFGYDQALVNRTNTSANFDKGFFSPTSTSDPLVPGRGYDVNISATELVDFVGTLNNGNISVPLVRNAASTLNADDAGWQFLGNPYPAPLDYSRVAPADRAGLEDAIYVYSSTSQYGGQYRAYVNGIGSGNPVLPVAQGFFARLATPGTSSTFTFRNSQRVTGPNATAFQRTAADSRALVQLELGMATGSADTFYAYAEAGATPAFDAAYDAAKLPNPTGLNLASLVGNERLAIDGRAAFTAATTIPLALSLPAAGAYSLRTAALTNLPTGLSPYLYDRQTGQTVRLTAGTPYTFSVTASQAAAPIVGRFTLLFSPLAPTASLSAAEVSVYPNPAHERFTVVVPAVAQATTVQADLLNTLGQVVRRQAAALPAAGTTLTVETADLATGVYVLRLQAAGSTLTKRVVVQ